MSDPENGSVDPLTGSLMVSSRDALAGALMGIYDHGTSPNAFREADALLASGVVRALPDEETVRKQAGDYVQRRSPWWHDRGVGIVQGSHYRSGFVDGATYAIAALFEGGSK